MTGSSFGEKLTILREKQLQEGGKSAGEELSEAQERLLHSRTFIETIGKADTIGIAYLKDVLGRAPAIATREWYDMSWEHQMTSLDSLAKAGSEAAANVLATLQLFNDSPIFSKILQTVLDEIGRPSRMIYSEAQLQILLADLIFKGLAKELPAPPTSKKAFKLMRMIEGKETVRYYTSTNLTKSRIAWPFVLKALGRVRAYAKIEKEILPKIQSLMEGATLGSNPEDQALQQLLTFPDKIGFVLIWDGKTRTWRGGQPEDAGLLAILIGRYQPGTNLILTGWKADKPLALPENEAYELPQTMISTKPDMGMEVDFRQAHRLEKGEWEAIVRIQRLIHWWLSQEGRFQILALTQAQTTQQ